MKTTKEELLLESLKLFAKYGYDGVSISMIANKLNIVKSAIYKHFKSKEDIFNSIIIKISNDDFDNATLYSLPTNNLCKENEKEYKGILINNIIEFSLYQYDYWQNDKYASLFKQMLIIERFKNKKISELYDNYFLNGPLNYMKEIFKMLNINNYENVAFKFYSILYLSYEIENNSIKKMLKEVLDNAI